jgi:hypothetical protein
LDNLLLLVLLVPTVLPGRPVRTNTKRIRRTYMKQKKIAHVIAP